MRRAQLKFHGTYSKALSCRRPEYGQVIALGRNSSCHTARRIWSPAGGKLWRLRLSPAAIGEVLLRETGLIVGAITTVLFYTVGDGWTSDLGDPIWTSVLFFWLFAVMLWCVFGVVRHAEALAALLGEPYGTLILTVAVIGIEASLIAAIMLSGDANPTLARDTMFAIYMIVLNGLVGLSLLVGGLRHVEQDYNLQGANSFLAVIVPLSVIALVLPSYTVTTSEASYSAGQAAFFSLATVLLYISFLAIQTSRHRDFFMQPRAETGSNQVEDGGRPSRAPDTAAVCPRRAAGPDTAPHRAARQGIGETGGFRNLHPGRPGAAWWRADRHPGADARRAWSPFARPSPISCSVL